VYHFDWRKSMAGLFSSICRGTSKLIHSLDFINEYKSSEQSFTRNRKIGFGENVAFILNTLSRSLQMEIDDFVERVMGNKGMEITKQAFSKSRKNISWKAFRELFELSRNRIFKQNEIKRFNGFRVFAIDASELVIDRTHDVSQYFIERPNGASNKSNARISLLVDTIDGFIIDANISSLEKSERCHAKEHLRVFEEYCNKKDIVIFDRGYPSKEMIAVISNMKCKYLMRLQASSFKGASDNSKNDFNITITQENTKYSVLIIKLVLNTGESETLITNLNENEFDTVDFQELYAMRWAVETTYNTIKNKLLIEKFSGRTVLSIHQDFFAAMFLANCTAAISAEVEESLSALKKDCKYKYRANRNLIVGYLKFRLSYIILQDSSKITKHCKKLLKLCFRQPVPVKPNRSFTRPIFSHQRKVSCPKYAI
jgi:hypothetical protein